MTVFLRWGVFGIVGVAALIYAYNASKRMAETRAASPSPSMAAPATPAAQAEPPAVAPEQREVPVAASPDPRYAAPAHCEAELVVAQRAIEMRKRGEPLDRVLRIQEVAWQEPVARRQRLEKVATRWFGYEGDFLPEALRIAVISDCVQHSPPP